MAKAMNFADRFAAFFTSSLFAWQRLLQTVRDGCEDVKSFPLQYLHKFLIIFLNAALQN